MLRNESSTDHIFVKDVFEDYEKFGDIKSSGVEPGIVVGLLDSSTKRKKSAMIKIVKEPIKEKIYIDIVKYFASAANIYLDLITKNELTEICTIFESIRNFSIRESDIRQLIDRDIDNCPTYGKNHIVLVSELVDNYTDLGDCFVLDNAEKILFTDYIAKYRTPPQYILHPKCGDEPILLTGLMNIAACAKITGDIDWLGGSAKNSGVVISYDSSGPKIAKVINVDAGFAVTVDSLEMKNSRTQHSARNNPKDIQYGAMGECKFQFDALSESDHHYNEFIKSLYLIVHRYEASEADTLDELLRCLILRNGTYNHLGLSEEDSICILSKITSHIESLKKIYKEELEAYYKNNTEEINELLKIARLQDKAFIQHAKSLKYQLPVANQSLLATASTLFSRSNQQKLVSSAKETAKSVSTYFSKWTG